MIHKNTSLVKLSHQMKTQPIKYKGRKSQTILGI
uniref:Uncharacterized protein n=1 Tax=Rhizophora mucronata TaxID=61149 RepID=A0A2P2NRQ6_RHIMU